MRDGTGLPICVCVMFVSLLYIVNINTDFGGPNIIYDLILCLMAVVQNHASNTNDPSEVGFEECTIIIILHRKWKKAAYMGYCIGKYLHK